MQYIRRYQHRCTAVLHQKLARTWLGSSTASHSMPRMPLARPSSTYHEEMCRLSCFETCTPCLMPPCPSDVVRIGTTAGLLSPMTLWHKRPQIVAPSLRSTCMSMRDDPLAERAYVTVLVCTCVSMCCSAWPHSWNSVSTSRKVIRLGWPPIGGVWLHTCGSGAWVKRVRPSRTRMTACCLQC